MRSMHILVLLPALLVIASGCSRNTREKSVTLSETAACSVPQFARSESGKTIEIQFVERVSGERELMTQDCTTYMTHTQKMLANSGRKLGEGKVVGNAVGTAILLPFTVIGDVFQFGGRNSRTRCGGWVLKETETFEEDVIKQAKFAGDVYSTDGKLEVYDNGTVAHSLGGTVDARGSWTLCFAPTSLQASPTTLPASKKRCLR